MHPLIIARVLAGRSALRRRETWSAERLRAHQARALEELRSFAVARSPFYRRFHAGLERAPLGELPILTKQVLMERFDEVVTDPRLHLADLEAWLRDLRGDERFLGRYWVSTTSGSSGRKSIVPSDAREWSTVIASYARANEWAGVKAGLGRRVTMAVVSSTAPWHQSSRVATTLRSPMVRSHRFDASTPLPDLVARLNALDPEVLVAYASMVRILAEEQLAGRLRLRPRAVNCSSEVLTAEGRALATRAWGSPPFEVYAATETGGIAAECFAHRGMHLFEDLVIPEVVNAEGRPVPPGQSGDRLLVTVLFSRTLPLVRYEMTDRVRLSTETCPCGRPFRLVAAVEGRTDDVLRLPGLRTPTVDVHPVAVHQALDALPCAAWQVRQEADRLRLLVAGPPPGFEAGVVGGALAAALQRAGAAPIGVAVEVVETIAPGAAGKRPLIVARK
jgi:phenylacetate-coenzyme A ligase PaaK-like adenylate-forming protein